MKSLSRHRINHPSPPPSPTDPIRTHGPHNPYVPHVKMFIRLSRHPEERSDVGISNLPRHPKERSDVGISTTTTTTTRRHPEERSDVGISNPMLGITICYTPQVYNPQKILPSPLYQALPGLYGLLGRRETTLLYTYIYYISPNPLRKFLKFLYNVRSRKSTTYPNCPKNSVKKDAKKFGE